MCLTKHTNKLSQIRTKRPFSQFSYNVMCWFFGAVSLTQKRSTTVQMLSSPITKQGTQEHDVNARVVAKALRQTAVRTP